MQKGELTWDFNIRPSAVGRLYGLRLKFKQNHFPEVFVVNPDLNLLAKGRQLPHVYSNSPVRLCLHYPQYREWIPTQSIVVTIVPWAYLWLAYFEDWLISDEWKGGGKHPGENHVS